jgi:hypothetical protein
MPVSVEFFEYTVNPIRQQHEYDFLATGAERQRQRLVRIANHMVQFGLAGLTHTAHQRRLILLNYRPSDPPATSDLDMMLLARRHAETMGIDDNCFDIAQETCDRSHASGALGTQYGAQRFVGWENHAINYYAPGDGSAIGFDLTARENIFQQAKTPYDVLAIRTAGKHALLNQVEALYGGEWTETA